MLHLFQGYGIELEYMIVSRNDLAVLPVTDRILNFAAGSQVNEVDMGELSWSNELVLHVIELKTNGPVPRLAGVADLFQRDIRRIDTLLDLLEGRVMPTAMHPWMNPDREMKIWPHDDRTIYDTFHRIFDCRGHGWSNLQSMHINLPFGNDKEFGKLHAAIRLLLPLMPALAASSPLMDGKLTGLLDTRMDVYQNNARRVPSVSGKVIPEPLFTRADYEQYLLGAIYRDIAPLDPEGLLQFEWLNARGAIARFDRHAIEIRVLDVQECPRADIALASLIIEVLKAMVDEAWQGLAAQQQWDTDELFMILKDVIRDADQAVISNRRFLDAFGYPERGSCRAREFWQHLIEQVGDKVEHAASCRPVWDLYVERGCLARRIISALNGSEDPQRLFYVYRALCESLYNGELFRGA
ncbi:MAG: glutamate--cysteine ligase [Gammaproteobacteria bacterium]|nr:glutamate--cysteine ligase [Gammaproteobacteria bacterium]